MPRSSSDVCLVTAATKAYLPGAVVTVGSFLAHHPGFGGDVVVIHDGLAEEQREALEPMLRDRVRFEPVSPALSERLARLGAARPELGRKRPNFYSLEAFRVTGYRKVLFCDSDILFRQGVGELFQAEDALQCGGDGPSLRGWWRDARTFRPIEDPSRAGPAGALERTFNSGLLLIDTQLTGRRVHSELLALVSPETWRGTDTPLTDQLVLNRYFTGLRTLLAPTYNYLLRSRAAIWARDGLAAEDAKVLHFNVSIKPWMPGAMLRWTQGDARLSPEPAFALWYRAYMDCLATAHLRAASCAARAVQVERAGVGDQRGRWRAG